MALVVCDIMSLDGYVTGPNDRRANPFGDGAGMLHDWMFDAATAEDRAILQDMVDGCGAVVMGRKSFEKNEGGGGWRDGGPLGDTPCFGVTHNQPASSDPPVFTFVTDGVARAIEQTKNAAGSKVVGLQARPSCSMRPDQLAVQHMLAGWQWHAADPPGTLRQWQPGEQLPVEVHDIWCRPGLEEPWRIKAWS